MERQPGPQVLILLQSSLEFYHSDEEGHSSHQESNIFQAYLKVTNISKMFLSHILLQQGIRSACSQSILSLHAMSYLDWTGMQSNPT